MTLRFERFSQWEFLTLTGSGMIGDDPPKPMLRRTSWDCVMNLKVLPVAQSQLQHSNNKTRQAPSNSCHNPIIFNHPKSCQKTPHRRILSLGPLFSFRLRRATIIWLFALIRPKTGKQRRQFLLSLTKRDSRLESKYGGPNEICILFVYPVFLGVAAVRGADS